MAICSNCEHKLRCTFPCTEKTMFCDEYELVKSQPEPVEWDLNTMLADWGFSKTSEADH